MDILLVEDNATDLALAMRVLTREGITESVHAVHDGQEALEYLMAPREPLPRVVLLDLKMPRMGGIEVLRRIRASERTCDIPVVVLSSSTEPGDVAESRRAGANSFVVKPVDFKAFSTMVALVGRYWLHFNRAV